MDPRRCALRGEEEALTDELVVGGNDRAAGDSELAGECACAGDRVSGLQRAVGNREPNLLCDLRGQGDRQLGGDAEEHMITNWYKE